MSSTYSSIHDIINALTWLAIIVTAYLVLDAIDNDDDPDGYV